MQGISRFRRILLPLIAIFLISFSPAFADSFSVKRIGNLIPFNDNAFMITAPESGKLTIRIHDDISVYRVLEQEVEAGETTIHWDGCAFNHEKLAAKNYTVTARLNGKSGEEYSVSFGTPVEYTGQCLQYVLPSSATVSLKDPDEWFVEFRTVQKGTVTFAFQDMDGGSEERLYSVQTTGGRINRLTYTELTGKNPLAAGDYTVKAYENTKKEEAFLFEFSIREKTAEQKEVFLTGEILPRDEMTEDEIWQMMQKPSVVVDIDPFKHQKVYREKDRASASLGTLHGQTQGLKVMNLEGEWAFIGAWNHEEAEYIEGWVPVSVLKVTEPAPDYGILINKQRQTLDVYYRGKRIDTLEVSTGRPEEKHPEQETAAGSFLTGYHRVDFSTNGKKYDYVIQYDGGNLLHQIPYEWGKDKKDFSLGRGYLGAKASHACIRIQAEPGENGINAYWIWTHIPYHTRVMILDDPAERRPVTDRPTMIGKPLEKGDGRIRLVIENEEKATTGTTVKEIEGHRIGFARCTEKEYLKDPGTVTEKIRGLLADGCEKTVLICYWNKQNEDKHTAIQEAMARKGIKAGADLVVGNGNKTPLGCEAKGEGIILYGLGNAKKAGKRSAGTALKAEVIFDFRHEGERPIITLSPRDEKADTEEIIEKLVGDSIGSGISEVYFLAENQV